MRKFALVLVLALALPATAAARFGDRGDGTLVVKNARGQVGVTAKVGSALGRVDDGTITILDTSLNGTDDIQVIGADAPKLVRKDGSITYSGTKMRFRIIGGGYVLTVLGSGINVTAVGKGTVYGTDVRAGLISADGAPFTTLTGGLLGASFGLQ
jgi:hypothetical protein